MDELLSRIEALEERCRKQEEELRQLSQRLSAPVPVPFRVVNGAGHTVLEVDESAAGVRLRLLDGSGGFLVTLQGLRSGGDLAIHGTRGQVVISLASGHHGGALAVYDQGGALKGWLNVTESGGHVVTQHGEQG